MYVQIAGASRGVRSEIAQRQLLSIRAEKALGHRMQSRLYSTAGEN